MYACKRANTQGQYLATQTFGAHVQIHARARVKMKNGGRGEKRVASPMLSKDNVAVVVQVKVPIHDRVDARFSAQGDCVRKIILH